MAPDEPTTDPTAPQLETLEDDTPSTPDTGLVDAPPDVPAAPDPTYALQEWAGLPRYVCLICGWGSFDFQVFKPHMGQVHGSELILAEQMIQMIPSEVQTASGAPPTVGPRVTEAVGAVGAPYSTEEVAEAPPEDTPVEEDDASHTPPEEERP